MVTTSIKRVSKTSIFELSKVKNCMSRLCTNPFTRPLLVETAISRLWQGHLTGPWQGYTAKNVLSYPSRHILSQHPHSHPSDWVPRGHRGRQSRQHSKNGRKVHKQHKRSSHSAPYKPYGVGTRKHFFGSKSKKTKRFMIFDPKKGGVIFSTFLTPPHLPQNLKKVGFKWGGSRGVQTKNSLGDAFIGQNNDFTRG